MNPPIACVWTGKGFEPLPRSFPEAVANYGVGEVVVLSQVEERSKASHDHFFAQMQELWATRPERLEQAYPTADSFRKRALITTGHCDTNTTVCATRAEALRIVALVKVLAPESLAAIDGVVVTVFTAHSQSMRAMGKARFQQSKDDCLGWAYLQLGIEDQQPGPGERQERPPVAA